MLCVFAIEMNNEKLDEQWNVGEFKLTDSPIFSNFSLFIQFSIINLSHKTNEPKRFYKLFFSYHINFPHPRWEKFVTVG